LKKFLKIFLPLALGIGILIYFLSGFTSRQFDQIKNSIRHADYGLILLSLLLGLASHLIRAFRWKYLLYPIAGKHPRNINLVLSVGVSYLMNLGIPRSGEIGRAAILAKYEKLPFNKVMGTIIAERVADVLMLILFILLAFFLELKKITGFLSPYLPRHPGWTVTVLAGLFVAGLSVLYILSKSRHPYLRKIFTFAQGIIHGAMNIFTMPYKWIFILETLLIWFLYLAMLWVVMLAFPETAHLGFSAVIFTFVVGSLSIVLSNGGIGTYPVFVTEALRLFGISKEGGFAFSIVMWSAQTLLLIVMGVLSLVLLPVVNRENASSTDT